MSNRGAVAMAMSGWGPPAARPARRPGWSVLVACAVGCVRVMIVLFAAKRQPLVIVLLPVVAPLVVVVHELGHVAAVLAVGARPLVVRLFGDDRPRKLRVFGVVTMVGRGVVRGGGSVLHTPARSRWREAICGAGGVVATGALGAVLLRLLDPADRNASSLGLALLAGSLTSTLRNVTPMQMPGAEGGRPNDGLKLLKLLTSRRVVAPEQAAEILACLIDDRAEDASRLAVDAAERNPSPAALRLASLTCATCERLDEAIGFAERTLFLPPPVDAVHLGAAHTQIAWLRLRRDGRTALPGALDHAWHGDVQAPGPASLATMGWALLGGGHVVEAHAWFTAAARQIPRESEFRDTHATAVGLSRCAASLGNRPLAMAWLHQRGLVSDAPDLAGVPPITAGFAPPGARTWSSLDAQVLRRWEDSTSIATYVAFVVLTSILAAAAFSAGWGPGMLVALIPLFGIRLTRQALGRRRVRRAAAGQQAP